MFFNITTYITYGENNILTEVVKEPSSEIINGIDGAKESSSEIINGIDGIKESACKTCKTCPTCPTGDGVDYSQLYSHVPEEFDFWWKGKPKPFWRPEYADFCDNCWGYVRTEHWALPRFASLMKETHPLFNYGGPIYNRAWMEGPFWYYEYKGLHIEQLHVLNWEALTEGHFLATGMYLHTVVCKLCFIFVLLFICILIASLFIKSQKSYGKFLFLILFSLVYVFGSLLYFLYLYNNIRGTTMLWVTPVQPLQLVKGHKYPLYFPHFIWSPK